MKKRQFRYFAADFETTVYKGQTYTEVWSAAYVELYTELVVICHSIEEMFQNILEISGNLCFYFHNLKFDGEFWLSHLLNSNYKLAYEKINNQIRWIREKDMPEKSYKYSINDKGAWYSIVIKQNRRIIEIRDSLKLIPFSLEEIGKAFNTRHRKLQMKYEGFRYAGCQIPEHEKPYIRNDVLVLKEALEIMFAEGHNKLTIGSCCLDEFKKTFDKEEYAKLFPDLRELKLNVDKFGSPNAWIYINKSYHGGWCYLVPEKAEKLLSNGITADVNSLYPSVMSGESGNLYPIGKPIFWRGDVPKEALRANRVYFVRIKTRFYLKDGMLPCIQIKHNYLYKGTEWLTTSDVYDINTGKYSRYYIGIDGQIHDTYVELTLTETDFRLISEHYDLIDLEVLDGCYFQGIVGLFDLYQNKYINIKKNNKGALRTLAKLFLNNLYGKEATNDDSSFKFAWIDGEGVVNYDIVNEYDKMVGYIPCGSYITSYARCFTITHAQQNYHGPNQPGFAYADTDSIHCDGISKEELVDINVHPSNLLCWKLESYWDIGWFVRAKTYIEHVTHEDESQCEPYYNIKCAGMPEKSKKYFLYQMRKGRYKLEDFKVGISLPGKLKPKRIRGGVVLVKTPYVMRKR